MSHTTIFDAHGWKHCVALHDGYWKGDVVVKAWRTWDGESTPVILRPAARPDVEFFVRGLEIRSDGGQTELDLELAFAVGVAIGHHRLAARIVQEVERG